jgi:NADPH:quinone reductase-like Zn-dependent oxidoreductase
MSFTGKELTTRLDADSTLTVQLRERTWEAPKGRKVLVRMEASPANPSDLALLFAAADLENAAYSPGKLVAQMPAAYTRATSARHGLDLPAGSEGSGTVVAAGEDPAAQALMGKRVACVPGTTYAAYAYCDAAMAITIDDGVSAEQAASSFVNPMTTLGFVETMKAEGFTAMIHAAAASNLGQMLVRVCAEDGIDLINVVRSEEQVKLLQDLGAKYIVNSSAPDFMSSLVAAVSETGARLGFDPIGGGRMASAMLSAMEADAVRDIPFNRYGSDEFKKVYIYGKLDTGPTTISSNIGFAWNVGGWLLPHFLAKAGPEVVGRMRARVMKDLTTTFASHYSDRIALDDMLTREAACRYAAQRTGQKFLILPNG